MSEFSESDVKSWMLLALEKRCSLYKAIHYKLFWQAIDDFEIIERAHNYANNILRKLFDDSKSE